MILFGKIEECSYVKNSYKENHLGKRILLCGNLVQDEENSI